MNPFLYSTVAQPLGVTHFVPDLTGKPSTAVRPSAPSAVVLAGQALTPASGAKRRGATLPDTARTLLLAASLSWTALHAQAAPVNANIATASQLETIKGIGPKTAQIIIHERERSGPYESMQDLAERVRGIGPRKARALREAGLTVSSQPGASAGMAAR